MNRSQAKKLLPIIQAFAEGKTVQYRLLRGCGPWIDDGGADSILAFDPDSSEYRINPTLVVRWGIESADGAFFTTARSQKDAEAKACPGERVFKMVEVAE